MALSLRSLSLSLSLSLFTVIIRAVDIQLNKKNDDEILQTQQGRENNKLKAGKELQNDWENKSQEVITSIFVSPMKRAMSQT